MTKAVSSITIDVELREEIKKRRLNLSEIINDHLKEKFAIKPIKKQVAEAQKTAEDANNYKAKLEEAYNQQLEAIKKSDEERLKEKEIEFQKEREERKTLLLGIFSGIPEVDELTTEQLGNTQYLLGLIDVLQKKYGLRASVQKIRDYYMFK